MKAAPRNHWARIQGLKDSVGWKALCATGLVSKAKNAVQIFTGNSDIGAFDSLCCSAIEGMRIDKLKMLKMTLDETDNIVGGSTELNLKRFSRHRHGSFRSWFGSCGTTFSTRHIVYIHHPDAHPRKNISVHAR